MHNDPTFIKRWIRAGITCGFIGTFVYPLLIFAPLPDLVVIILASAFGPLLAVSSMGMYHLLRLNKKTITAQIAAGSCIIASVLVNMMLIIQLALNVYKQDHITDANRERVTEMLAWIWNVDLGLDISWDIYLGIATFFFALNMFSHPRYGKVMGIIGMIIGSVLLIGVNLYTFPYPPGEAGLVDVGPIAGLWYLISAIMSVRALKWADAKIDARAA